MNAKQLSCRSDANEFRNSHAGIGNQQRKHYERRPAHAKALANQIGKTLAGDRAHASAHFLDDSETDGYGNEDPEKTISVLSSNRSVRGDTARVIARVGGNHSRAENRKIGKQ